MKRIIVERFKASNIENKGVRLGLHDTSQVLFGRITEVSDDCIIFETDNAVSVISLDATKSIVLPGGW